jgi:hypothetical protein
MELRAYNLFLRLYPKEHRDLFGGEMAAVLRQAAEERRSMGRAGYFRFAIWEIAGLLAGAAAVWAAKMAGQGHVEQAPETPVALLNSVAETERLIQRNVDCMVNAIATHQFAKARFYSDVERKLRTRLQELRGD